MAKSIGKIEKLKQFKKREIIKIILLVIVVVGFIWILIDWRQTKQQVAFLTNPQAQEEVYQKELKEVVSQVSKLIILPEGSPNLVTIQDAQALAAQQPFFKDAENGDKILIYKDRAIIFSPTRNMLVNVGPVYAQDNQNTSTTEAGVEKTEEDSGSLVE